MGNVVEIGQSRGIVEDDLPQLLAVDGTVRPLQGTKPLLQQIPQSIVTVQEFMVDGVGVQDTGPQLFQGVEGGCLPRPGGAGDADNFYADPLPMWNGPL